MFENMIVIGENLNATRKLKADGPRVVPIPGKPGRTGLRYTDAAGETAYLDITKELQMEAVKNSGRLPHVGVAIWQEDDRYLVALAVEQEKLGADYLDLCVDEAATDAGKRRDYIRWLVKTIQEQVDLPLCIDSSDPDVVRAAFEVYDFENHGTPMINSANLEPRRLPLLDIVAECGCDIIVNASGAETLPPDKEGRVANLVKMMGLVDKKGITHDSIYLDPLVLPIGTDSRNGVYYLDAAKEMRERYPEAHITGGFSNVSFGLPNRRAINEAMTYLAKENGADCAFIDPSQVKSFRPGEKDFDLACDALLGKDEFCMEYISYTRSLK